LRDLGRRYRCLRELGGGGTGTVYLVRDAHLGRELALKLLDRRSPGEDLVREIQDEFSLLSGIDHPGIARVHDFGTIAERPFFTSDYVDGVPFGGRAAGKAPGEVLGRALEVADALAFLHRSGILHLDLKPTNILLPRRGGRAVLIDFGLGLRWSPAAGRHRIRGSVPYMAPECFEGEPPRPWTDIYAFGATVYHALCARYPRMAPLSRSWSGGEEIRWEPAPPALRTRRSDLPEDVERVVLRCLALDPRERFPSAVELLASLERAMGRPATGCSTFPPAVPLIGRTAELAEVDRFLDGLLRGTDSPRILLVTGAPGMGQSRFLRDVKVRAQLRGLRFFIETGYPGRASSPGAFLRSIEENLADRTSLRRWKAFLSEIQKPRLVPPGESVESEYRLRHAIEAGLAARAISGLQLLAFDGLQWCDEVSLEVLLGLVRSLVQGEPAERASLGLILGCREEGPSAGLIREMTSLLLRPGAASVITLHPLGLRETVELYSLRKGERAGDAPGFALHERTGGSPAKIAALTPRGDAAGSNAGEARGTSAGREIRSPPGGGPATGPASGPAAAPCSVLDATMERVLLTLFLLRRPAAVEEIARLAGVAGPRLGPILAALKRSELAAKAEGPPGREEWLALPRSRDLLAGIPGLAVRKLHRRIANGLVRGGGKSDGERLVEALHYFQSAGDERKLFKHGLAAARYLRSTMQNRLALQTLRAASIAALRFPPRLRARVALEMAEVQGRIGEFAEGIQSLEEVLRATGKLPAATRLRILIRMGTFHSRRGDFQRAEGLFRTALQSWKHGLRVTRLGRGELLAFLTERAALKVVLGEYAEARRLCDEGLRMMGAARSRWSRETSLNLLATRANAALRTFDHASAIRDFLGSLEIAESIGSTVNRAVVLNNLATAYGQVDRYRDAVRTFREAERSCRILDDGPSLVAIQGNLALLHAKMGEFDRMKASLAEAEKLHRGGANRREDFLLQQARGLSLLYRGRYRDARDSLDAAIRLGMAIGDPLITRFDEVYRAEALLFEGATGDAEAELARLGSKESPPRVRRLALARSAFLEALAGRRDAADEAAREHGRLVDANPNRFLDAWDGLFIAWARALQGDGEAARTILEPARRYFIAHDLRPSSALSGCILAEVERLAGHPERGLALLEPIEPLDGGIAEVLRPLLQAELFLGGATTDGDDPARLTRRVSDLVARADSQLVGNPLPMFGARLDALRARLAARAGGSGGRGKAGKNPRRAAAGARAGTTSRTAPIAGRGAAAASRGLLVARSPAMRELAEELDRLRGSELPVLIEGETGAGKDLVARIIHEESPRSGKPYFVADISALPAALLEAELFGARAGAFTGIERDRPGILRQTEGGTLLVDGISGAASDVQAKLLRVLAEGSFRPLGGEEEVHADVRFLFSSTADLEAETRAGRFRRDLLHRIRVLHVRVPALRERAEDLGDLVRRFWESESGEDRAPSRRLLERLRAHDWPGNVRELKNLVARARLLAPERPSLEAMEAILRPSETESLVPGAVLSREPLPALKERLERDYILHHFRRLRGDAAALRGFLGLSAAQLYRRCGRLGIRLRRERRRFDLPETRRGKGGDRSGGKEMD